MTTLQDIPGFPAPNTVQYKRLYQHVLSAAFLILRINFNLSNTSYNDDKALSSYYGIEKTAAVALFFLLTSLPSCLDMLPMHMFWALAYLKQYPSEQNLAIMLDTNTKTLKSWIYKVIDAMDKISDDLVS